MQISKLHLLIILMCLSSLSCSKKTSQSTATSSLWENDIINFYPNQNMAEDKDSYAKGKYILENTYKALLDKNKVYDWSDYFNLALGFSFTNGDKSDIQYSFDKALELNRINSCRMLNSFDDNNQYHLTLKRALGNHYVKQVDQCKK